MNFRYLLFLILFCCISCAEKKTDETIKTTQGSTNESPIPEKLQKIFEAHGGLSLFQTFGSLELTLAKEGQSTSYKTNLKTEKTLVEGPDFTLGFDGKGKWTKDDTNDFNELLYSESSKKLYSAAMPFIVVQDGAFYTERLDEQILRVNYGVIHIGFDRTSGKSPDDEYVIYYDKETYQMVWLAYRMVEYGRYKRKYWRFVKYTAFQNTNELLLPEKWTLYEAKGDQPTNKLSATEITELNLSEETFPDSAFEAPEGSVFE